MKDFQERQAGERTGKSYRIVALADFLDVPDDRLDECLREFGLALRMSRATVMLLSSAADAIGKPVKWRAPTSFDWTDDDAGDYTVNLQIPTPSGGFEDGGKIVYGKSEYPEYVAPRQALLENSDAVEKE